MKSPYKRIVVYDLETGGLSAQRNSITEIAMVAIDMESLEIIDKKSILIKPRLDLTNRLCKMDDDKDIALGVIGAKEEAKAIFKAISIKDNETNIKTITYGEERLTLKNLQPLIDGIEFFEENFLSKRGSIIEYDVYELLSRSKFKDIIEIYFQMCYNPIALEYSKIPKKLIINEGENYKDVFVEVEQFIIKHTLGNSKPILSGHNIKNFDNSFLQKMFESNNKDLYSIVNKTQMIDTLEWARLAFFELPSYSLGTVCNEVGITLKDAHRALPDTIENVNLVIKLLKNLRGEGTMESKYERKKINVSDMWQEE